MKRQHIHFPWLIAGLIALGTALLHLFQGQLDLVLPLMETEMSPELIAQWLGAWHLISGGLCLGAVVLLLASWRAGSSWARQAVPAMGAWYILGGLAFVGVSVIQGILAPQWVLLLPIGGLAFWRPASAQNLD